MMGDVMTGDVISDAIVLGASRAAERRPAACQRRRRARSGSDSELQDRQRRNIRDELGYIRGNKTEYVRVYGGRAAAVTRNRSTWAAAACATRCPGSDRQITSRSEPGREIGAEASRSSACCSSCSSVFVAPCPLAPPVGGRTCRVGRGREGCHTTSRCPARRLRHLLLLGQG